MAMSKLNSMVTRAAARVDIFEVTSGKHQANSEGGKAGSLDGSVYGDSVKM
jgi:hypothetical protein